MKTQLLVLALWSFALNFVQPQNPPAPDGRTSSFLFHPQLSTLPLGLHAVGFQVFNHYDYGRHFQPKQDFEGKPTAEKTTLPIQISMWYPAQANKSEKMLFAEYLYLDKQKNTFKPLSEAEKKEAGNGLKFLAKFGSDLDLSEQQIQNILQSPTAATLNAPKQNGTFPVIIAGVDGGPGTRTMSCVNTWRVWVMSFCSRPALRIPEPGRPNNPNWPWPSALATWNTCWLFCAAKPLPIPKEWGYWAAILMAYRPFCSK